NASLALRSKNVQRRGAFYMRPQGGCLCPGGYGIRPYDFVFDQREKTPPHLLFIILRSEEVQPIP
uniref:hypothetical protein n=1 Tax=Gemmiger formicilis TaxID=745368 RepID=UPI003FEEF448